MKVSELIEQLQKLPQDYDVMLYDGEYDTQYLISDVGITIDQIDKDKKVVEMY